MYLDTVTSSRQSVSGGLYKVRLRERDLFRRHCFWYLEWYHWTCGPCEGSAETHGATALWKLADDRRMGVTSLMP